MKDVVVRRAAPGDEVRMTAIWLDNGEYYAGLDATEFRVPQKPGMSEWTLKNLEAAPANDEVTLVAEIDGVVVGFLEARVVGPVPDPERQYVSELAESRLVIPALAVERPAWRRGAGTALIEGAEEWGRTIGATIACVETWAGSPVSGQFYEKTVGYERRTIGYRKRLS